MTIHHGTLLCLGVLLMTSGGIMIFSSGTAYPSTIPLMVLGIFLGMGGLSVMVAGVCMAKKNLQVGVPGHFLLHPPTGTRFSPQQALAIQRRLDRIRREMSTDAVSTSPEPEPSLPSTPPPWTMEPPPSYDTVMKSQHINREANQEHGEEPNDEEPNDEELNDEEPNDEEHNDEEHNDEEHNDEELNEQQLPEHTECTNQDGSQQV